MDGAAGGHRRRPEGCDDVAAVSVAGQQHGMVCLDEPGEVVRPALLWNDTRSAAAAADLVARAGGGDPASGRLGGGGRHACRWPRSPSTKLRWLADARAGERGQGRRRRLPHDWLTWRLAGGGGLDDLVTDRSDASGTGYFDAVANVWRRDLLARALRCDDRDAAAISLPRVLGPHDVAGRGTASLGMEHLVLGPGCGDNAGAALGLGLRPGQTLVSVGTSGVVASVSTVHTADPSGIVAGFADASGHHLPLACTLNGARVLDATAGLLGVDHDGLDALALSAGAGAGGLVLVPYLEGERTPNVPGARGQLHGVTSSNLTRENLARAAVEGLAGLLGQAIDGMRAQGVLVDAVTVTGGGARSEAFRRIAPTMWGLPVDVPDPAEDVALGAARQAAWVLSAATLPPTWSARRSRTLVGRHEEEARAAYDAAATRVANG